MNIPEALSKLLTSDDLQSSLATVAWNRAEPWLRENRVVFFPEYTDHSIVHVEKVIRTAVSLIADDAWEVVSAADASALVIATLLHDCGMHLGPDGFLALLARGRATLPYMSDVPWPQLWADYLIEARRFDEPTLCRLFGEPTPISMPSDDPATWTQPHFMLIGEFLRRHHARFAHEVAYWGVPTREQSLDIVDTDDMSRRFLIGLIARSHGMALRNAIAILDQHPQLNRRSAFNVHATFLMGLLRVGDYLQVQADRAPAQRIAIQALRSPLSQREWAAHDAIRDFHCDEDLEALAIVAEPPNVAVYIHLHDLIAGLQYELDQTWAVLGEVYSRFTKERYDKFGLTLRRIRSNLDDPIVQAGLPYEPRRVQLSVDARILPQMVSPLYGERPEFGVRELLQNSLDAVLERRAYESGYSTDHNSENLMDVLVHFIQGDDGRWRLEVTDRGIGMTPATVSAYFLRAGASYRESIEWSKRFIDGDGTTRVVRSGRFGLGVYSAFLLGGQMDVSTRFIDAQTGVHFSVSLNSEIIELHRRELPIGTHIVIPLSNRATKLLCLPEQPVSESELLPWSGWDWLTSSDPRVERRITFATGESHSRFTSEPTQQLNRSVISSDSIESVEWTLTPKGTVVCNGIRIGTPKASDEKGVEIQPATWRWSSEARFRRIATPNVAVVDRHGLLPLTLKRDGLRSSLRLPFEEDVANDVSRDFLAFCLVCAPTRPLWETGVSVIPASSYLNFYPLQSMRHFDHEHTISFGDRERLSWCCTGSEVMPFDEALVCHLGVDEFLIVGLPILHFLGGDSPPLIGRIEPFAMNGNVAATVVLDFFEYAYSAARMDMERAYMRVLLQRAKERNWPPYGDLTGVHIFARDKQRKYKWPLTHLRIDPNTCDIKEEGDIVSLTSGSPPRSGSDLRAVLEGVVDAIPFFEPYVAHLAVALKPPKGDKSRIAELWLRTIGERGIPFEPEDRDSLCRDVCRRDSRVAAHIERWKNYEPQWRMSENCRFGH
jgi:molecular chaperone HtpG